MVSARGFLVVAVGCFAALAFGEGGAHASTADSLLAAARALESEGKAAAAESAFAAAAAHLESNAGTPPETLVDAHLGFAASRATRRFLADGAARASAERALELSEACGAAADSLRAESQYVLGWILHEENRSADAIAPLEAAVAWRRSALGPNVIKLAESLLRLGRAFDRSGNSEAALATMREALEVRIRAKVPRDADIARTRSEIGAVLESRGDFEAARAEMERALEEQEAQFGPRDASLCQILQRYATLEFHAANNPRAADLLHRAIQIADANPDYNPTSAGLLRGNLASALLEIGDFERARMLVEPTIPLFETRLGDKHRQTNWLRFLLAMALRGTGRLEEARALLARAQAALESDSTITDTGQLSGILILQSEMLQEQDPVAALPFAIRAEAVESARPRPNGTFVVGTIAQQLRLRAILGEWNEVDALTKRMDAELEARGLRGAKADVLALSVLSRAEALRGRRDSAIHFAHDGSRLARELQTRTVRTLSDREALAHVTLWVEPFEVLLDQAVTPASAEAPLAWDELVRWRGLVSAEVARRRPPPGVGLDPSSAAAHETWIAARRRLAHFEMQMLGAPPTDETRERLAQLKARAEDTERAWALDAPLAWRRSEVYVDVGLDAVLAAIGPRDALISFLPLKWPGRPTRLGALLATGGGGTAEAARSRVIALELGEAASIEAEVTGWLELLGRSPRGNANAEQDALEAGRRVRERLWDPLYAACPEAERVWIVPESFLFDLPWGALPREDATCLVESGPSIHVLAAERDLLAGPATDLGEGLLALGGIEFERARLEESGETIQLAASTRSILRNCNEGIETFGPLPATEAEVRDIERLWRDGAPKSEGDATTVLLADAATESAFKAMAPGRRVLHVATHGLVVGDSCAAPSPGTRGVGGVAPLDGAVVATPAAVKSEPAEPVATADRRPDPWLGRRVVLAFAGANRADEHERDENEGLLTADEVATLDLRGVDWVVLSACHSGAGETWEMEGLLGMRRAFHLAGARSVIASAWPVDDESTREWMSALYAARAAQPGISAADAARVASRRVLAERRASGASVHPFYWAAFTATGN